MNKVFFMGHLGADPEVRYTESGTAVANFRMAASESWTKDGEKQERTEWMNVVAWKKTAELVGEYLRKGSACLVEGRLQTRKWEKDGVERYTTEIVADRVTFVGGKAQQSGEDDLPF